MKSRFKAKPGKIEKASSRTSSSSNLFFFQNEETAKKQPFQSIGKALINLHFSDEKTSAEEEDQSISSMIHLYFPDRNTGASYHSFCLPRLDIVLAKPTEGLSVGRCMFESSM